MPMAKAVQFNLSGCPEINLDNLPNDSLVDVPLMNMLTAS